MAVVLDPPPTVTYKAILSGHQQTFPVASAGTGEITASHGGAFLPNITSGTPVKVEIAAQDFMTCELSVMTQLGQIIGKQTFRIDAGTQQFSVPFNQYAPGVYYLSLKTDKGTLPAMRVIKQ